MELEISEKPLQGWDEFLLSKENGTIYQSTFYANYAEKDIGFKPFYIRVSESGDIKAQLLCFESNKYYGLRKSFVYPIVKRIFKQIHWVYGPVGNEEKYIQKVLEGSKRLCMEKKLRMTGSSEFPLNNFDTIFSQVGFKPTDKATFLIDLHEGEEQLWKKVDKAARKIVNRTKEEGIIVKPVNDIEKLREYYFVVNENRARNHLGPLPYSEELWKIFRENNVGEILVAEKEGRVLSGLGISFFNGYLNEWGAGTSAFALEKKIYASDLIKWHVISEGIKRGFHFFDLSGVSANPKNEKEMGIYRFKQKWGGKLILYKEWSL